MRKQNVLIIDVAKKTAVSKELSPVSIREGFFGVGSIVELLNDYDEALAISTGPLTGTGAPCSSGFLWCHAKKGQGIKLYPSEGRLASAIRQNGLDSVVFVCSDKAPMACHISIANESADIAQAAEGKGRVTYKAVYEAALSANASSDSCIVAPGSSAVIEDDYFVIGDAAVAKALRAMGICSIAADFNGSIPIEKPKDFLKESLRLWQLEREASAASSLELQASSPKAAYLSTHAAATRDSKRGRLRKLPIGKVEPMSIFYAAVGLSWPTKSQATDAKDGARACKKLLSACLGETVSTRDVEAGAAKLVNSLMDNGEGGWYIHE